MKQYLTLSLLVMAVMAMTSCTHVKIGDKDGSIFDLANGHTNNTPTQVHQVGTETAMNTFDGLNVAGPFNVIFEQGEGCTVRVDGTTEQLEKMTIYVKEGELFIDQRKNEPKGTFDGMRIFVSAPMIDGIEIAGSGTVTASKQLPVKGTGLLPLCEKYSAKKSTSEMLFCRRPSRLTVCPRKELRTMVLLRSIMLRETMGQLSPKNCLCGYSLKWQDGQSWNQVQESEGSIAVSLLYRISLTVLTAERSIREPIGTYMGKKLSYGAVFPVFIKRLRKLNAIPDPSRKQTFSVRLSKPSMKFTADRMISCRS